MQEKTTSFTIKQWSEDDKPREKLIHKGKSILSDAELIAIIIGSGSKNESAVSLSKQILASVNHNLNDLGKLSVPQLMKFKGIGEAKAVSIVAAMELSLRRGLEEGKKRIKITSSRQAYELLQPKMGTLPHEEFWIVYLNNSNKVIHTAQLSKGGITGTLVDVRLVVKQALELSAVALILAHNHPSGTTQPSLADKKITKKIEIAAHALDLKVLDHLIITQKDFYSFADNKLL